MRRLLSITTSHLILVWVMALLAGCHGDVNELDIPQSGGEDTPSLDNGLILSVDKERIEADGVDYVTFSLTLDGVELTTDDSTLANVYIKHEKSGQRLEKWETTFSAVKNGDYSFVASYRGKQSANSVQVKAVNRELYEPYGQKILVCDLTGTWCPACPMMTASLENVSEQWRSNMIVAAMHVSIAGSDDPWAIGSVGNDMLTQFGGVGYPSCIYDLVMLSDNKTSSGIGSIIEEHLGAYPATCGVKIASSSLNNGVLTIDAEMHSPKGGEYELGYAILLDNQIYEGGTATNGEYDDIVVAISPNFNGAMGDKRVTLSADERHSQQFTINNFPLSETEDMRVVVFALGRKDGRVIVDNANVCRLGESVDYTPVDYYDGIPDEGDDETTPPEGVLRLYVDKTTLMADGVDAATFRVMYGSEDVSNARTMYLKRTFNGETIELTGGSNSFTTTVPGIYTFTARYYKGGNIISDNEVEIYVSSAASEDAVEFRHKMLGFQFTSIGCPNCPTLSEVIKSIQSEKPERLIPISFHIDYQIEDPMNIPAADLYYQEIKGNGLPVFGIDLRGNGGMICSKSAIEAEMQKIMENYPPTCGVAISTNFDPSTRKLTVIPRIKSNIASSYRYQIFLVEDGIQTTQYGKTGLYTHYNVVRAVLLDNVYGGKFNSGTLLSVGVDTPLSSPIVATINDEWDETKMRVVVTVLSSNDGGGSYVCVNSNETTLGESVDYALESSEGGSDQPGGEDTSNITFNKHVSVFEFTGTTCAFCPAGYVYLKYLIEDYYNPDEVHILAFHDTYEDPMGIQLTHTIYNDFSLPAFPSFIVDMREAFEDKSRLSDAIDTSFEGYPATCGVKISSSCDASGELNIDVEVYATAKDSYRLALYILEDGIVAPQNRNGTWEDDYVHYHVVRSLVSSIYEGDRLGELSADEKLSKSYQVSLDADWVVENCSICALVIDGNGYVNNVAACAVGASVDYDYE